MVYVLQGYDRAVAETVKQCIEGVRFPLPPLSRSSRYGWLSVMGTFASYLKDNMSQGVAPKQGRVSALHF